MGMDPAGVNPGDPRTFNRFAYANNNPYKFVDPDGRFAMLAWFATPPGIAALEMTGTALLGIMGGVAIYNEGAKDSPATTTDSDSGEWIYGPKNDSKINDDGSTKPNTWTTPDDFTDQDNAQDKLDPFKPLDGRRSAKIPKGTSVKKGKTPGGEGPYNGSGGGNETLIPNGLPPGSVGPWEPL